MTNSKFNPLNPLGNTWQQYFNKRKRKRKDHGATLKSELGNKTFNELFPLLMLFKKAFSYKHHSHDKENLPSFF